MNVFRTAAPLVLAGPIVIGSGGPTLAVEVAHHPDQCRILARTGKSEAGRDPESRRTCARVDNRPPHHIVRHPHKKHERPIDRLRSRGEGRPKASGDKGAKRQLHKHHRAPHARSRHHHRHR
jgi:hypothetical protein